MLIAYLDEFGHVGPYISDGHPRFGQHPIFGYAGFIVPAQAARSIGAEFKRAKTQLFSTDIARSSSPAQWERKGAEYFSTGSIQSRPEQVRVFNSLLSSLRTKGGRLFFYGDEKRRGTIKETGRDSGDVTRSALRETVNRICTYAESQRDDVMILMDQITEKSRVELVSSMYAHIYGRSRTEMQRVVEAPLHIDSKLNSGVQFADWICGLLSRASHYHTVKESPFSWAPTLFAGAVRGLFTHESKLHLLAGEVHHQDLFSTTPFCSRPLSPTAVGRRVDLTAVYEAALRARGRSDATRPS